MGVPTSSGEERKKRATGVITIEYGSAGSNGGGAWRWKFGKKRGIGWQTAGWQARLGEGDGSSNSDSSKGETDNEREQRAMGLRGRKKGAQARYSASGLKPCGHRAKGDRTRIRQGRAALGAARSASGAGLLGPALSKDGCGCWAAFENTSRATGMIDVGQRAVGEETDVVRGRQGAALQAVSFNCPERLCPNLAQPESDLTRPGFATTATVLLTRHGGAHKCLTRQVIHNVLCAGVPQSRRPWS